MTRRPVPSRHGTLDPLVPPCGRLLAALLLALAAFAPAAKAQAYSASAYQSVVQKFCFDPFVEHSQPDLTGLLLMPEEPGQIILSVPETFIDISYLEGPTYGCHVSWHMLAAAHGPGFSEAPRLLRRSRAATVMAIADQFDIDVGWRLLDCHPELEQFAVPLLVVGGVELDDEFALVTAVLNTTSTAEVWLVVTSPCGEDR